MLRITTRNDSDVTCFIVEGKLAGQCVCELEKCWRSAITREPSSRVVVDLTSVTFIDAGGKELLTRMVAEGANFIATLLMPKAIIEEISRSKRERSAGN